MNVPIICMNPGCKYVMKAKPLEYGEDKEENAKLDVLDAAKKCPKCNAKLTKYLHKVWDKVKNDEEILKVFGMPDSKKMEAGQTKYQEAKKETEAQFDREVKKYRMAV